MIPRTVCVPVIQRDERNVTNSIETLLDVSGFKSSTGLSLISQVSEELHSSLEGRVLDFI